MLLQHPTGQDDSQLTDQKKGRKQDHSLPLGVSTMETSSGATSLNVDITKFTGEDMMEEVLKLQMQSDDHKILKMLEEGRHADITLTAQGGSVKAHRSVLSVASPVFKAMFEHDMKEQLSSTVHIPDMTIEGLQLFLLVLYTTDEFTSSTMNNYPDRPMLELFSAGIDKQFNELFKGLSKYQAFRRRLEPFLKVALERNLNPDNCWEYYDISLQFREESYSSIVREYIVKNFYEVVESANFLLEMKRDVDRVYSILIEAGRQSQDEKRKILDLGIEALQYARSILMKKRARR